MSKTLSALRGTPRAKPNDMIGRVGAPSAAAEALADLLLQRVGIAVGGVDDMVGPAPQRRHQLALGGDAVGRPGGRAPADGGAASPR